MNPTYLRYELLRTVRNRRGFILSLVLPLVLFYLFAGANRHVTLDGIPFPTYYLASMASFGTMAAMIGVGARISVERSVGWTRQLRLTPLSTRTYMRTKVLTGYATAFVTLVLLFIAGMTLGVHLNAKDVVHMTGLVFVGLIPFAALGILLGHLFTPDSMGPVFGLGISVLAVIGGVWTPFGGTHGFLHIVSEATPTYWLVQARYVLLGAHGWDTTGWLVIAAWTVILGGLAAWAFRRDTSRV